MENTINNAWITLSEQRNGIDVQRKFAGLNTYIDQEDTVNYCNIYYWERELYPNGEVIKTEYKSYSLKNLPENINEVDGWKQNELAVLEGFINTLGYDGIINPARLTLANIGLLSLTAEEGYPLHRDTRVKIDL